MLVDEIVNKIVESISAPFVEEAEAGPKQWAFRKLTKPPVGAPSSTLRTLIGIPVALPGINKEGYIRNIVKTSNKMRGVTLVTKDGEEFYVNVNKAFLHDLASHVGSEKYAHKFELSNPEERMDQLLKSYKYHKSRPLSPEQLIDMRKSISDLAATEERMVNRMKRSPVDISYVKDVESGSVTLMPTEKAVEAEKLGLVRIIKTPQLDKKIEELEEQYIKRMSKTKGE